jgi:hypothetical protein
MNKLNREDEQLLRDMLIKAFYGYKLHLNNEPSPCFAVFEEMAYRSYHMMPTDYAKVQINFLEPTIDSIVGQILNWRKSE